jgi:hypothetical protein
MDKIASELLGVAKNFLAASRNPYEAMHSAFGLAKHQLKDVEVIGNDRYKVAIGYNKPGKKWVGVELDSRPEIWEERSKDALLKKIGIKEASMKVGANPKDVLREVDHFVVDMAEGHRRTGLPILEGKKFKTLQDLERAVNKFEYPDGGYDKAFIKLKMKDGSTLNFRYDHGERDPSLTKQFNEYAKRSLKEASGKVAGPERDYMFMGRMQQDLDYTLDERSPAYGVEKHLMMLNFEDQIKEMKKLWNRVDEKPEWLTKQDIADYERRIKKLRRSKKAKRDGYIMDMTYETWDEEALEHGDTDDRGYEYKNERYDDLEELLNDSPVRYESWVDWSSSRPGKNSWIISDKDENYRTGEITYRNLFIKRADGKPLDKDELRLIKKELGV